ncbi:YgaP family membrane protein [Psychroserpens luteolus]|uniref:YgaP family membrane protein n=1 Tax=Psychroserpens luteolus TaxID=2855840 RepID=UPI001E50446C|nr:DUF2892 domain-containing protein [Psychroserpens luteolus]MCD2259591.1 DUF2892 domain-containing protein [Psychroserpens luteolus]
MKSNVGTSDKVIRIALAIVIGVLYFADIISGTWSYVLLGFAFILILTSVMSFCPIYKLLGINSCSLKTK